MITRIGIGAALCAALSGSVGCGDGGDSGAFLIDSKFPGSSVTDANLAQDGRAFTNANESAGDVRTFWNVDGTAILLAATETDSSRQLLYASYFDGSSFTAPVQIRGDHDDASDNFSHLRVLFLNERSRKGDAIITFVRNDEDDSTSANADDRDANKRLWGTYFDRSLASKALVGTVRFGFEPTATAIDFDHVLDDNMLTVPEEEDPDVLSVALVSDSLHGTHDFTAEYADVVSGDTTTQVHIVFAKGQSNGTTVLGVKWQSVTFDLAQVGNAIPKQASALAGTLASAGGAYDDDATVGTFDNVYLGAPVPFAPPAAIAHDGYFVWQIQELGTDDEDSLTTVSLFTPMGTATPILLGSDVTPDQDATVVYSAQNIFGPDNGLDAFYAVALERGFTTGMNGARAGDVDVIATQIDVGGTTRQVREIDAFTAPLSTADVDGDGFVVNAGSDGVSGFTSIPQARLSKDGSYIGVLFGQVNRTKSDLNDGDMMTINGPTNVVAYAQVIQTRRNGEVRALADSVLAAPVEVPALESTGDLIPLPVPVPQQADIADLEFQIELGTSAGNGGAYQSNVNRMFFSFTQLADQIGGGRVPFQNVLYVNSLEVTPGGPGAAPSLALGQTTTAGSRVALPSSAPGQDSGYAIDFRAIVVDRADAVNGYLAFFIANANNTADSTVTGAFAEPRLYAYDGTSTVLVSSAGVALDRLVRNEPWVRTVGTRNGTRIHVLWHETVDMNGTATELLARSFEKARNVFAPLAADAPIALDLITENTIEAGPYAFVDGTTLGVYFIEGGHIFYEQTTGDATRFHTSSGDRDPQLVDNESLEVVQNHSIFAPPLEDNLSNGIVAFWKEDINNDFRVYLRVHN